MEKDEILKRYIKVFLLIQVKNINYTPKTIEFEFDDLKTGFCFGTVIDGIPIALVSNKIYPEFNYSPQTELNTYYLLSVLDYGTPIPLTDKSMVLEDDPEELRKKYKVTVDWYYNELLKNEKQNIKSFEKEKAKLLNR